MKTTGWICWLLAVCICFSEAKNKIRRPLSSSYAPTLMLKKPRPISHRISMGNPVSINGNLPSSHQKMPYKYINYRIRRPVMYNALPINWKNQIPMRAVFSNRAVLPQRVPVKEFYSINKIPEYSSEYRPELIALPPIHRGDIDDDKGPIHTIPAPNLSLADKPYNSEEITDHRPYSSNLNYHTIVQNPMTTTSELVNTLSSNLPLQRTGTSSTPLQHQYEVTESNDVALKEYQTIPPAILQPQDLDITRLYSIIMNNPPQSNQLFTNHPVISNMDTGPTNMQFEQSNVPIQTNLRTSLHVGLPATISQIPYTITQQIPADLHVGHPAPAGPPLSATQLYELLNKFPEQYTSEQQQMLQQQLGQIFQPGTATSFSQPQMHSFNYDEQDQMQQQQQQLQQQQILLDQNYASNGVTTDYNLKPVPSLDIRKENNNVHINEEFTYLKDGADQSENNIDYEEVMQNSTMYFNKIPDNNIISTNFYTTLPNREAAEKLAALAAAGNVNSRLIGQLRKQQEKDMQKDNSMPSNHKNSDNDVNRQQTDSDQQQKNNQPTLYYKSQQQYSEQSYMTQDREKPLQITAPNEDDYVMSDDDQQSNIKRDSIDMEYEYENEDEEIEDSHSATLFENEKPSYDNNSYTEFGSRLRTKIKN